MSAVSSNPELAWKFIHIDTPESIVHTLQSPSINSKEFNAIMTSVIFKYQGGDISKENFGEILTLAYQKLVDDLDHHNNSLFFGNRLVEVLEEITPSTNIEFRRELVEFILNAHYCGWVIKDETKEKLEYLTAPTFNERATYVAGVIGSASASTANLVGRVTFEVYQKCAPLVVEYAQKVIGSLNPPQAAIEESKE